MPQIHSKIRFAAQLIFICLVGLSTSAKADATDCYEKAIRFSGVHLSKESATFLCRAAKNNAPADCAEKLTEFSGVYLNKDLAVRVCVGAEDLSPVKCVERATSSSGLHLSKEAAVDLCSKPIGLSIN